MRRLGVAIGLLVAAGWLALFWAAKIRLFEGLEYTSDLFLFLQAATSLVDGRAPLHENFWGGHAKVHGYWLLLLFGPAARWLGARGLFASHLALLAAAALGIVRLAKSRAQPAQPGHFAALVFLIGPVSFWLWDDPTYGWHLETLYLPLACLFVTAMITGSRSAWLWGAAIAALREDGPIVGWALHVTWEATRPDLGALLTRARRLSVITLAWFLVFAADMAILFVNQGALRASRPVLLLSLAGHVLRDPRLREIYGASLLDVMALLAAGALAVIPVIRSRSFAVAAVAVVPILAAAEVASLAYYAADPRLHGVSWPARFAMFWALLAGASLVALQAREYSSRLSFRAAAALAIAAAAGSCAAQAFALQARRNYPLLTRLSLGPAQPLQSDALSATELSALRCLGRQLPRGTVVCASGSLYGALDRLLIAQADRLTSALRFPDLFVCDTRGRLRWDYGCDAVRAQLPGDYRQARLEGLRVGSLARFGAVVAGCGFAEAPQQ